MALVKPQKTTEMTAKQVVEQKKETVETVEVEQEVQTEVETVEAEQTTKVETVTEEVQDEVEAEEVQTEVTEEVQAEQSEISGELVEDDKPAQASTQVATASQSTQIAASGNKAMVGIKKVIADAEDEGFAGLEFGFGSFPMVKLVNEGIFEDSDEQPLGKHIRATLMQSTPIWMYVQDGNDDGPVAYSYDQVTVQAFKGDDDANFKTIAEVVDAWTNDGYETVEKKYLEVVATIHEDSSEYLEGEVPDALLDLEGQTVMFRLAPASLKAFSGCMGTLKMQGKPMAGALMDFKVGPKRKSGNGKSYFPWKFLLVRQ